MTVLNFPPVLRIPIASVTIGGTAHHQSPAVAALTLCGLPVPETAELSPFWPDATEHEPINCEGCELALWYAGKLLESHSDHHPADPVGLRWSAGASLAAAFAIDGLDTPIPGIDDEAGE
jgi:hypothetical protein